MNGVQILVQRLKNISEIYIQYIYIHTYMIYMTFITCFLWKQLLFIVARSAKMDFIYLHLYSSYIFKILNWFCNLAVLDLAINTHLQVLDMDWTLMHTVISQGYMEMTGETRFCQVQPATKFLQTTEQDKADVRAGWGSDTGGYLSRGFSLRPFVPFIGWWKI